MHEAKERQFPNYLEAVTRGLIRVALEPLRPNKIRQIPLPKTEWSELTRNERLKVREFFQSNAGVDDDAAINYRIRDLKDKLQALLESAVPLHRVRGKKFPKNWTEEEKKVLEPLYQKWDAELGEKREKLEKFSRDRAYRDCVIYMQQYLERRKTWVETYQGDAGSMALITEVNSGRTRLGEAIQLLATMMDL
ncbi:unnamed protein product [Amoebophrya sp. A25]|nr:unnamed protein product [Amoebophrya sp. A25]|eukprot:GSA25T00022090001.1